MYRKAFCRTLPIAFEREGEHDGIKAYWFAIQENAFESSLDDPSTSCYCRNGKCLPKGLGDISPCWYSKYLGCLLCQFQLFIVVFLRADIPFAVSLPHFYKGDPALVEAVDGLNPTKEKHDAVIIMQPVCFSAKKGKIRS